MAPTGVIATVDAAVAVAGGVGGGLHTSAVAVTVVGVGDDFNTSLP